MSNAVPIPIPNGLDTPRYEPAELALFASLIDSSDDAIMSKTLDGVITTWNRSAERMYGYSAAEATGVSKTSVPAG